MRRFILLQFCLLASVFLFSQTGNFEGMRNASVMLYDFWAITGNQAGLTKIDKPTVGISYHNGFLINETGTQFAGFVYPTKSGNFNFSISRFGYAHYSENTIKIGYSRKINEVLSASVQFDYFYLHQSEAYQNKSLLFFEAGVIAKPIENLFIGVHIYNPSQTKITDYQNERINTTMRLGMGYQFANNLIFTFETEKSIQHKIRFKSGLAYTVIENLKLKAGVGTNPNQFSFGLAYQLQKLGFDVAFTTHQQLPITSKASLTYEF